MLRRGFKSEANRYAREFRLELGVPAWAFVPLATCKTLISPGLRPLRICRSWFAGRVLLSDQGLWEFSGATFISGSRRLIVINDAHPPKRQASDLSHELSHCILGHTPYPKCQAIGSRQHDPAQEEEANYLGPTLLISEELPL